MNERIPSIFTPWSGYAFEQHEVDGEENFPLQEMPMSVSFRG